MEKADQEYLDDDDYWDFGSDFCSAIPLDEPARVIHIPISRSKDEDVPSSTFGMDKETMGMEKEISLKWSNWGPLSDKAWKSMIRRMTA